MAVVILLQKEKSEQQLSVLFIHKVLVLIVFTKVRDCGHLDIWGDKLSA